MNYELCKKLKDAGFPQKEGFIWYYLEKKHVKNNQTGDWYTREAEWKYFRHKNPKALNIEWYYAPSLEELIEECGERFLELYKNPIDKCFIAYSNNKHEFECTGATPSEAVANLYLQLHKLSTP